MSTNLHCGEAASHKTQKNRMLKAEVSCYSRTMYLSYWIPGSIWLAELPPMGFNVTSELKCIHIYTFLNRKLHDEMRQTLATDRKKRIF